MAANLIESLWLTGYGTAAASGTVQFFAPGTQTQVTVYSNDAATAAVTQPVPLDANGRTSVPCYVIAPARAIIYDVNGALLADIERVDGDRAEMVALSNSHWPNSSSVNVAFTNLAVSLGGKDGGYQGVGAGTVSRSLQQKLTDQISVRDYGAKGDGVADDTAAINSALATVAASGMQGCVYLPAGTYITSAPVAITGAGTTLRGDGPAVSIIMNTNSSLNGISLSAVANVSVQELGVQNSGTSTGAAIGALGSAHTFYRLNLSGHRNGITGVSGRCLFVDVATDNNAAGAAFTMGGSSEFYSCVCNANSATSMGIQVGSVATRIMVLGCTFPNLVTGGGTTGGGVNFTNAHLITQGCISNNSFHNATQGGIAIQNPATASVYGISIFNNTGRFVENFGGGGTLGVGTFIAPVATVATLDLSAGRHHKVVGAADYSLTYSTGAAGPFVGDLVTVIAQNTSGGGITLTAGAHVKLATGGIAIAATSQAAFTMVFDRVNTQTLAQVGAAVITALS